jgi:hypothetical protein
MTTTWTEPPRDWTDGELVNESIADAHIRDQLKATWHLISRKSADETVTSSTTFQADDHLFWTVGANETWHTRWSLIFDGSTSGDIQIRFTFPGGTLYYHIIQYLTSADVVGNTLTRETTSPSVARDLSGIAPGAGRMISFDLQYQNGGSGGTFALEWAQNASNATGTVMRTNSCIFGCKLA